MTYIKDGAEHLDHDELVVYNRIRSLAAAGRTGNNSQIANGTFVSRTRVGQITDQLRARGFITDVSKGAAHHWRVTTQPVPYPVEARNAAVSERIRQAELNEQIRKDAYDTEMRQLIERDFCPYSEAKITRERCAGLGCRSCQADLAERDRRAAAGDDQAQDAQFEADCCDECKGIDPGELADVLASIDGSFGLHGMSYQELAREIIAKLSK